MLLKRPKWFLRNRDNEDEILGYICLFDRIMKGERLTIEDIKSIIRAGWDVALNGHNITGTGKGLWVLKRIFTILTSKKYEPSLHIGYGWKEPNTHIFLPFIIRYFNQKIKYIHVVRHGLDMAFSKKQNQLYNWGVLYDISIEESIPLSRLSLQFWIKANKHVISTARELLGDRFLLVNFDNLCLRPEEEIKRIIGFVRGHMGKLDDLKKIPQQPESMGRYKRYDISIFTEDEIKAVREFGFEI